MKLYTKLILSTLLLLTAGCAGTVKTAIPEGVVPAVVDVTPPFMAARIVDIVSVDGAETSSKWSPAAYPRKAELTPGEHTIEFQFWRNDFVPVGSRTVFGKKELKFTVESGKVYTVDWQVRSISTGFLSSKYEIDARIIEKADK